MPREKKHLTPRAGQWRRHNFGLMIERSESHDKDPCEVRQEGGVCHRSSWYRGAWSCVLCLQYPECLQSIPVEIVKNLKYFMKISTYVNISTTIFQHQGIFLFSPFLGQRHYFSLSSLIQNLHLLGRMIVQKNQYSLETILRHEVEDLSQITKFSFKSINQMKDLANKLGVVFIFVSGSSACPIQTLIPSNICLEKPIIIGIGSTGFLHTEPLISSDQSFKKKKNKCYCGKNTGEILMKHW